MTRRIGLLAAGVAALLSACVPRPPAPAPAPPTPPPAPAPQPEAPAAPPPSVDWRDAAISPGEWRYDNDGRSLAYFGPAGAPSLALRCDGGGVALTRSGSAGGQPLTITTTFGERTLRAETQGSSAVATLSAGDPLLDQMAFSRGRFMVRGGGAAPLYVPAWPELARVVEDCRGGA
ncbi:hypothetical protein GCM10023232_26520 [Sphingosinicella ginsenosidimutans]|uniref:Lipoprotein n=1 Tax=Allosphingosinicella ginsenosidimutans TaxID=1176539 RepID=A0A5C6TUT5_9SPHN|nr:hypothetical protein [Sphingosinicella ginsenosidimutans]TXC63731.1 hypothetical protein FRZ32_08695 [Sphingosinicella ginsenosidimutans]